MAWSDKLHGSWEMATYQQTGTLNTNSSPGRFAEVVVLLLYISLALEVGSVWLKVTPLPVLPGRVPSPPSPAQARLAAEGGVRKSTRSSRLVSPTSTSRLPPHLVSRSVFYGPTKYEVQISILLLYPAVWQVGEYDDEPQQESDHGEEEGEVEVSLLLLGPPPERCQLLQHDFRLEDNNIQGVSYYVDVGTP